VGDPRCFRDRPYISDPLLTFSHFSPRNSEQEMKKNWNMGKIHGNILPWRFRAVKIINDGIFQQEPCANPGKVRV
jgi:hypothetical protein